MTSRAWRGAVALLVALVAVLPVMAGVAQAGPCDDPTDTSPNPRQIPNCVVVTYGPYAFTKFQHAQWKASCPEPNSLFLGNAQGYLGDQGFEVDNNCFSFWVYTPEFDDELETLVINWCDKPETVNLSLGCLPGD